MNQHLRRPESCDSIGPERSDMALCWYLAQLRPGGLNRARSNLQRQGYQCFMPSLEVTRRHAGVMRAARRPLFPGYLFVGLEPGRQPWRKINSTYGVARLVTLDGKQPTAVPEAVIEELQSRCRGELWAPDPEDLRPGATVRVLNGPLAETIATIARVPEADRVIILFQMMGRTVRATIERATLAPA